MGVGGSPAERTKKSGAPIKLAQPFPAPELQAGNLRTWGFCVQRATQTKNILELILHLIADTDTAKRSGNQFFVADADRAVFLQRGGVSIDFKKMSDREQIQIQTQRNITLWHKIITYKHFSKIIISAKLRFFMRNSLKRSFVPGDLESAKSLENCENDSQGICMKSIIISLPKDLAWNPLFWEFADESFISDFTISQGVRDCDVFVPNTLTPKLARNTFMESLPLHFLFNIFWEIHWVLILSHLWYVRNNFVSAMLCSNHFRYEVGQTDTTSGSYHS